jgi:NADPH:quinone reductase-like Zn-dependent oxidoreductase
MFAVYAREANFNDPLAALALGERPEPMIPEGWVRVKISHASLNRHDIFTLRGITAQKEPIPYPMVLGTDGTGTLDDGTEVVIYPVLGSEAARQASVVAIAAPLSLEAEPDRDTLISENMDAASR